jgi:hypothetical protein
VETIRLECGCLVGDKGIKYSRRCKRDVKALESNRAYLQAKRMLNDAGLTGVVTHVSKGAK